MGILFFNYINKIIFYILFISIFFIRIINKTAFNLFCKL